MTDLIVDACSIINWSNGDCTGLILELPHAFYVGELVVEECNSSQRELTTHIDSGLISIVESASLSGSRFIELIDKSGLGEGETECILAAEQFGYSVVSDDRRARNVVKDELGTNRLTGTIGLLRELVAGGVISDEDAMARYSSMVAGGGFLPSLSIEDFS